MASTRPPLSRERYLFFGGKGGVGKTTAASAAALSLLDSAKGDERILLFSTDPAHSLSDSLDLEVGDHVREVARQGRARLYACEMDAARALERFKAEHRATLHEIAERGTLLDEQDVNQLLDLSLPGLDEVMALFELSEFDRAATYQRVVVDTAPSGHTSRLLRLPEVFTHMLSALDRMADKHRYIIAQFARGGRVREDEVDLFLRDLGERITRVRAMLYDGERASFTLVTIPEAMSFEETARYFKLLESEGVPVTDLIVNRVEREHGGCRYCRARAASQKPWLKKIGREFKGLRMRVVPLMPEEVRGPNALRRFGRVVWREADDAEVQGRENTATQRHVDAEKPLISVESSQKCSSDFEIEPRRLLIFGGKGGVGKTTAASAAALALAETDERARVLVFSTDPAHSLSDSFDEQVGELKKGVAGLPNLDAMEIDPAARFEELRERYRVWTDELFTSLTGDSRWEIQFDREAMRELVALAPPGIDEIAALSVVSDLLDQHRYTTIVLDTAPTGHLVRFLELPGVALSWVRAFIKLLLKYQNVVRASGVAEELIALSKNIKRVAALLTDAGKCEFISVAIPERMSLEETVRLSDSLERLKVPLHRLLINGIVPEDAVCDFCAARRRAQAESVAQFEKRFARRCQLFLAPQQAHEIRGAARLREHFSCWLSLHKTEKARERKAKRASAAVDGRPKRRSIES